MSFRSPIFLLLLFLLTSCLGTSHVCYIPHYKNSEANYPYKYYKHNTRNEYQISIIENGLSMTILPPLESYHGKGDWINIRVIYNNKSNNPIQIPLDHFKLIMNQQEQKGIHEFLGDYYPNTYRIGVDTILNNLYITPNDSLIYNITYNGLARLASDKAANYLDTINAVIVFKDIIVNKNLLKIDTIHLNPIPGKPHPM